MTESTSKEKAEGGTSQFEITVTRLRGQLQNCVNCLERAKRNSHGREQQIYAGAVESANKALYETLAK